jgi:hypothetical protein
MQACDDNQEKAPLSIARSAGPPGNRNGQYRHGGRTKAAIAEQRKQRIAENASGSPEMNT